MPIIRTPADRLIDALADAPPERAEATLYAITRERVTSLMLDIVAKNARLGLRYAAVPEQKARRVVVEAILDAARFAATQEGVER